MGEFHCLFPCSLKAKAVGISAGEYDAIAIADVIAFANYDIAKLVHLRGVHCESS